MNREGDLWTQIGASWTGLLQQLGDALIIIDSDRNLRFVNDPARRLLGYDDDETIGGRCRNTTKGTDCFTSCPLTYALENDLEHVDDFATVYRTRDGRPVPLRVTVIPLRDEEGRLVASAELLRPAEPDSGFFLCGTSDAAASLRSRALELAASPSHLVLTGERPCVADVARAVHRLSGRREDLFFTWNGSWSEIPEWPPGTVFVTAAEAEDALAATPHQGWRIIVGAPANGAGVELGLDPVERFDLPPASERADDLPLIVAGWLRQLAPGCRATPAALKRLALTAAELGLERLEEVLVTAVAAAGEGRVDEEHLVSESAGSAMVDDLLQRPDPLAALEERLIRATLQSCEWRVQEAADRLGISRVTLWRKMRDHCIEKHS